MSVKATIVSATDPTTLGDAIATANSAIGAAKTIVIPTDTVYGIATDAFSVEGVGNLLAAKGVPGRCPCRYSFTTSLCYRVWPTRFLRTPAPWLPSSGPVLSP